jgi:NAD(P)-dependent dehydrogenase (short-subunit alcohol dehydrogenase family)
MNESVLGLEDKIVVVTGSSQGVGLGCVRQFARVGAHVVLVGRRSDPLEAAAREIRELGRQVLAVPADVTVDEDIEALVSATMERFGRVDVLINNVGGRRGKPDGAFLDSGPEYWRQTLDLNLQTVLACTQAFARAMVSTGTPGTVINIASVAAYKASPNLAPYGAAKAALVQLTKTLALELAPHGIRVAGVAPGMVDTDSLREWLDDDALAARARHLPARRIATPDDLGRIAVMMASDLGAWVYGSTLVADGGELIAAGG